MFKSTSFEKIEERADNVILINNIKECPAQSVQKIIKEQNIKFENI